MDTIELVQALRILAATQHGLFSRAQALLLGFTPDMIRHHLRAGNWTRLTHRVFALPGTPSTPARTAMTAVLDAGSGAVISHASAAALWGIPGYILNPLHVTQPRGGLRPADPIARLHRSRAIPETHVKVLDGIPLMSPTRTLFDLAGAPNVHPLKVARTLDTTWGKRLTTGPLLMAMLDELKGKGRPGIGLMRELILERGRDYVPPESSLERRFHALVKEDGQEPMERQANLGGECWLARVDAYDWRARVVAQVHSDRYHTALIDRRHDGDQTAALEAAGFVIVEIWEPEVWYDGRAVQLRVRQARAEGRRRWVGQPWTPRRAA